MEVLFSVEYIIPPLIIDGVSNFLFPGIWAISACYWIVDHLLHIHPTKKLWCVYFPLFPPFSLSAFPTDVPRHWQGFISFNVCSPYPPCAKWVTHFWGGYVINPVTLTNVDAMAPQFSSPYFCHDSWSISHNPSNNSPWDTHLSPPV